MSTNVVDDLRDPSLVWWPDTPLPHHTTLKVFTEQPPSKHPMGTQVVTLPVHMPKAALPRPFLVAGYTLHVGPNWELLTVDGSEDPIAVYRRTYGLRVHEKYQRRGLGVMMFVWRCELRGQPSREKQVKRSAESWHLRKKGHRILIERALQRGCLVPADVLADYPDLANGE